MRCFSRRQHLKRLNKLMEVVVLGESIKTEPMTKTKHNTNFSYSNKNTQIYSKVKITSIWVKEMEVCLIRIQQAIRGKRT